MRQADVERWVVEVLSRIERGERIEDDRVELKRELPADPRKLARRIAGHANQARDDRILWVIGAHDDAGVNRVPGLPDNMPDAAEWWPPVEALFDDVAPSPVMVFVNHDGRTVLGIGFLTDRTPYLIKVPNDNPSREVPWRAGTGIRSANRPDLLRLLVPIAHRPVITVLGGELGVRAIEDNRWRWHGTVTAYVETKEPLVIPDHLCSAEASFGAGAFALEVRCLTLQGFVPSAIRAPAVPDSTVVERGEEQLLIATHSRFRVGLSSETDFLESTVAAGARGALSVELTTAWDRITVRLAAELRPGTAEHGLTARWEIHP